MKQERFGPEYIYLERAEKIASKAAHNTPL